MQPAKTEVVETTTTIEQVESAPGGILLESEIARAYDNNQLSLSWIQAVRANPRAILWCCYALFTCIMYGYDVLAGAIVIAIARFRQDYGSPFEGAYVIPAKWQLAFTGASFAGLIVSSVITGFCAKRFGRQVCMAGAYMITVLAVFLQFFSDGSLRIFCVSKFFTGMPLGTFITIAPTYCSEIAPLVVRSTTTAAVSWCSTFGQLLAYAVMCRTSLYDSPNSYRIIFAVQWGFAAVALIILPFFPESPYHLVTQGKIEKAKRNMVRINGPGFDIEGSLSSIQVAIDAEKNAEKVGFAECFRGTNRLRTFIGVSIFFICANSGTAWVMGFMSYFMILGGMNPNNAYVASVGLCILQLGGNMASWVVIEKFGRRKTCVWGTFTLIVSLIMIGIMSVVRVKSAIIAQVAFMGVWSFAYQATIGGASWVVLTEVPTSALRGHTQSLGTLTTGLTGMFWSFVLPYCVNPDEANMGGKVAFMYGGMLLLCFFPVYWYYPETKGRTFAEIDLLFNMGIPPRKFHKTKLEIVADDTKAEPVS